MSAADTARPQAIDWRWSRRPDPDWRDHDHPVWDRPDGPTTADLEEE